MTATLYKEFSIYSNFTVMRRVDLEYDMPARMWSRIRTFWRSKYRRTWWCRVAPHRWIRERAVWQASLWQLSSSSSRRTHWISSLWSRFKPCCTLGTPLRGWADRYNSSNSNKSIAAQGAVKTSICLQCSILPISQQLERAVQRSEWQIWTAIRILHLKGSLRKNRSICCLVALLRRRRTIM